MTKTAARDFFGIDPISPPHRLTTVEYEAGLGLLKDAFATVIHEDKAKGEEANNDAREWASNIAVEPSFSLNDVIVKLAWGVRDLGGAEAHGAAEANPIAFRLMASALSDVILLRAAFLAKTQPVDDEGPL